MATVFQFSRNIRKYGSRIQNNAVSTTKRAAKKALTSLVEGTPVDKGVARSNWRVSLGNPTRAVIPAYAPGTKLGIGESANAKATIAAGFAQINRLTAGVNYPTGEAGTALYIANAVPYLSKLRAGYSAQQPADWVLSALQQAQVEVKTSRLLSTKVEF